MKLLNLFAFLFIALPSRTLGAPGQLLVGDFGAKCDGQTDDTASILKAVQAASARGMSGGNVVYFPPSKGCVIASPLNLPDTDWRVTLEFDSLVQLNATLTLGSNYTLRGKSPWPKVAFATEGGTTFNMGYGAGPAIHIHGTGTRLENLAVGYMHGKSDGILVDGSAQIALKNVWVSMDQGNTTGIPLKIIGGFGYEIEGGGYTAAWNSQNGSIVFSDSPACNWSGIFRMRKTFLSGHGIILRESCGGLNSLSFEDILFESAREPFLTVYALGGSGVWGIDIRGMNFADSQGSGFPVVSAHSPVNRIRNISIMNSSTDGGAPLTAGDAISGLHVW